MKKNKPVVAVPAECVNCANYRSHIAKQEQTVAEYKKAYETLKTKLQTIFNITQL